MIWKYKHRQTFVWQAIWQDEAHFACLNRATQRGLLVGWGCRWLGSDFMDPCLKHQAWLHGPIKSKGFLRLCRMGPCWGSVMHELWRGGEHFSQIPSSSKVGQGGQQPSLSITKEMEDEDWKAALCWQASSSGHNGVKLSLVWVSVCMYIVLAYSVLCILINLWFKLSKKLQ